MKISLIRDIDKAVRSDGVNIVPYGVINEINFKKQLDGSAKQLVDMGKFSLKTGGVTLLASVSDNYGVKKRSVFVFGGGKLIGICDMNAYDDKYSSAVGYKIFSVGSSKIGVLVDRDIYDPDAVKALAMCDASAIVNLYEGFSARKAEVLSEAYSYVYGVHFVHVSENSAYAYDCGGDKVFNENAENASFELSECKKCYEIKIKRKGVRK